MLTMRTYAEGERQGGLRAPATLPDCVTVLTCIGCGAMGREERCDGDCSEHKLLLVSAIDYDVLPGDGDLLVVRGMRQRRHAPAVSWSLCLASRGLGQPRPL